MSVVDFMPGILAVAVTVMMVFALMKLQGKAKMKKEVLFLRPRDKRGEKFEITKETDRSIFCEKADPVHRFLKISPAYSVKDRGATTLFIGIEGSAYTAKTKDANSVNQTVVEHLKSVWGDKIYEGLPEKLKKIIEEDKIGITVEPEKIDEKSHKLEHMSSDDVNDEGDAVVLNRLANTGNKENVKQKMLGNLVWLFLGVGLAAILSNMGWF